MQLMQLKYSPRADALYVQLGDQPVAYSKDISRDGDYTRGVDYAEDGTPVGVELLNVSKGVDLTNVPRAGEVASLLSAHGIRQLA